MLELRLRWLAQRDLDRIWDYTCERWSEAQAERYFAQMRAAIERLRSAPQLGRAMDGTPFWRRSCGSHFIFYHADATTLEIVRILHQSMDFAAHFPDDA
jgi:toxin ParE1/3/4